MFDPKFNPIPSHLRRKVAVVIKDNGVKKVVVEETLKPITEKILFDLKKDGQEWILLEFGLSKKDVRLLNTEKKRVKKILELNLMK